MTFIQLYEEELRHALQTYPHEYVYPESEVPVVVGRMSEAIRRGGFNKDSRALRVVCRRLQIPFTYAAIQRAFLTSQAGHD